MNYERMEDQLILHEGIRTAAYECTEGYWTIGVGYNMETRGLDFLEQTIGRSVTPPDGDLSKVRITEAEARQVLRADIKRIEGVILQLLPEYAQVGDVRQRVILDMSYNLGRAGSLKFKKARAAIAKGNWSQFTREIFNSRWANQVDDGEGGRFGRADRLAQMALTNRDYVV